MRLSFIQTLNCKIALSIVFFIFFTLPAFADITVVQAEQIAVSVVSDPKVTLTYQGETNIGVNTCYHFKGSRNDHLTVDIDISSGDLIYFSWTSKMLEDGTKPIDATKADQLLSAILQKFVSQDNQKGLVKMKTTLIDHGGSDKEYAQYWLKIIGATHYPFSVRIAIRAQTGEMISFQLVDQQKDLPKLKPKITEKDAVDKAAPYANKILMDGWQNIRNYLNISYPVENQSLQWVTEFSGYKLQPYNSYIGQEALSTDVVIFIDATTGKFIKQQVFTSDPLKKILVKPPLPHPVALTAADYWPQWSASGNSILFYIWRELQENFPRETYSQRRKKGNVSGDKSILAKVDDGNVTALMWTPQRSNHPTWSPNEKRIAFEGWIDGPLYDLEMAMPMLRPMGNSQRFDFEMPCWGPLGKNLVFSRSSLEDKIGHDIMVSRVIELPVGYYASAKNSWLARMEGDDILPVFSPDGKNVVFAHQLSLPADSDYLTIRYSLYMVSANQVVGDKDYVPPKMIVSDIPTPTRISWFPDGQKVLLSYQNGDWYDKSQNNLYPPEAVDIKNGKRTSLGWPVLHDPDLPTGFPLVPEEMTVSPSGDRVAFSAMRWSGNSKDKGARVIYSCTLGGSDLRRETPYDLKESDMKIYQYPKPGVNAKNAFEKLLVPMPKSKPVP